MIDNICTLPLSSDLIAQAIHPSEPLVSVGLSTGHVQTFRLPSVNESQYNASPSASKASPKPAITSNGRRLSENGFDTVDTAWRTRRHKGSCRSLTFSGDGSTLFSAGTDGLIKGATTETGRVTSKIAIPLLPTTGRLDLPSLIHCLSPQNLLLGTDSGRLHVYDLRTPNFSPSAQPAQSYRPHVTEEDPDFDQALASITPLPPTAASTSGTSRSWITTAGGTVAMSDLRKGVVSVSVDQRDELLCSACIGGAKATPVPSKRTLNGTNVSAGTSTEKVLVGGARGVITLWQRGQWQDQRGRIVVHKQNGVPDDDATVDSLTLLPERISLPGSGRDGTVAAGLGNGMIRFVAIRGWGGKVIGEVSHDEQTVEGVTALGFDVAGRMISGGGPFVKVWHAKDSNEADEELEEDDDPDESGSDSDDDSLDSDDESADEDNSEERSDASPPPQKKKKKKQSHAKESKDGEHGIRAFKGMD